MRPIARSTPLKRPSRNGILLIVLQNGTRIAIATFKLLPIELCTARNITEGSKSGFARENPYFYESDPFVLAI